MKCLCADTGLLLVSQTTVWSLSWSRPQHSSQMCRSPLWVPWIFIMSLLHLSPSTKILHLPRMCQILGLGSAGPCLNLWWCVQELSLDLKPRGRSCIIRPELSTQDLNNHGQTFQNLVFLIGIHGNVSLDSHLFCCVHLLDSCCHSRAQTLEPAMALDSKVGELILWTMPNGRMEGSSVRPRSGPVLHWVGPHASLED